MAAHFSSPDVNPVAAAALVEEGDAAYARCKKVLPPNWVGALKAERLYLSPLKPIIERHLQRSPDVWQAAVRLEADGELQRRVLRVRNTADAVLLPRCDSCGDRAVQLKWCTACRLKRYCSKDCQKRDFPAHKAECKQARGKA